MATYEEAARVRHEAAEQITQALGVGYRSVDIPFDEGKKGNIIRITLNDPPRPGIGLPQEFQGIPVVFDFPEPSSRADIQAAALRAAPSPCG